MASPKPDYLSADQVRRLRIRAQRLAFRQGGHSVAQVLTEVCAVQAQELPAAALSIRARSDGLLAADVQHARLVERSVVRTWCLRGTLHLIPTEDYAWLIQLLGPSHLAGSRRRLAQMGLDGDTTARALQVIREILASQGLLTRAQIAEELSRQGGIRAEGQARVHLIYQAAMRGILCEGPDQGSESTYILVDDWIRRERPLLPEQALAELALRYLKAYGPAEPRDLAAWSGLSLGQARQGWDQIAGQLTEVAFDGRPLWMLTSQAGWLAEPPDIAANIRLLPRYDTYLLGYASRDLAVAPEYSQRINRGGGILHPALLVDGRAQGTWSATRRRDSIQIAIEPFEGLSRDWLPGIESEIADLGRFLGVEAEREIRGRG